MLTGTASGSIAFGINTNLATSVNNMLDGTHTTSSSVRFSSDWTTHGSGVWLQSIDARASKLWGVNANNKVVYGGFTGALTELTAVTNAAVIATSNTTVWVVTSSGIVKTCAQPCTAESVWMDVLAPPVVS